NLISGCRQPVRGTRNRASFSHAVVAPFMHRFPFVRSFRDRRDAGRRLTQWMDAYAGNPDVIVLALPRGGVPVAYEIATRLGVPLDVLVVRKLGVPGHAEVAMGAIASG